MSRKSILLLHGALGSQRQFEKLKDALSTNFEVYSFDFEGHGGVISTRRFSMDYFTENVIDYLDAKDISSSNVFGYSMGGYVALNVAKKHPSRILKIITLGTKFNWTSETVRKEVKMLNPELIQQKIPAFAQVLEKRHFPTDWKSVLSKTAEMLEELGNGEAYSEEVLKKISHEVLICTGELDNMVSQEESKKAAVLLPNGSFQTVPNAQHPVEKVPVEVIYNIILKFL